MEKNTVSEFLKCIVARFFRGIILKIETFLAIS